MKLAKKVPIDVFIRKICKMNYAKLLKNDKYFLSLTSIHIAKYKKYNF
jgi:hypothetical protein